MWFSPCSPVCRMTLANLRQWSQTTLFRSFMEESAVWVPFSLLSVSGKCSEAIMGTSIICPDSIRRRKFRCIFLKRVRRTAEFPRFRRFLRTLRFSFRHVYQHPFSVVTFASMILSDRDIKAAIKSGKVKIESENPELLSYIHASSMDLRLGNVFKIYEHSKSAVLDPKNPKTFAAAMRTITIADGDPFIVQPGEFILGVTQEKITVPDDMVVRVEGRSSIGRMGIIIHSTAGFVDPGFSGTITLEISNLNRMPIALYPGMRVCQIAFETMSSPAETPYDKKPYSKYQGQMLPEESRLSIDPEFVKIPEPPNC